MGLDQYAFSVKPKYFSYMEQYEAMPQTCQAEWDAAGKFHNEFIRPYKTDMCRWRKHADLNEWMTQLAVRKGVVDAPIEFNCVNLELTTEDIDELEKCVQGDGLPHGEGFFWGQSQEEDYNDDVKFIRDARKAFKRGDSVIYSCWW